MTKRVIHLALGLTITTVLNAMLLRIGDVRAVTPAESAIDTRGLRAAVALRVLALGVRSLPCRRLLHGQPPTAALFQASIVGFAVNYLMPIRVPARSYVLALAFLVAGVCGALAPALILAKWRAMPGLLGLALVGWICQCAVSYLVILAFPIGASILIALLGGSVANFATLLPSAPGAVGALDASLIKRLIDLKAVNVEIATAYALVVDTVVVVPIVVLGAIVAWRTDLWLGHLAQFMLRLRPGALAARAAASLIGLALTLFVLPILGPQDAAAAPGGVPSVSDPRYFVGANVPWLNWGCDFGCGDGNGVSSPGTQAALADGFGRLKAAGVHTVRWWTFEGDPVQITRDTSGSPTGLNPAVYADFDAALALADQYDLAYDFVLFSAPTAMPRAWITDPKQRKALSDALAPLFERYKDNPRILAWELINEPEWDMWNNKIPQAAVQATVKVLANTVHAHTSTAVTIGSATLEGVPLWVGQGVDFYSPHWYDTMPSGAVCARCTDAATVMGRYNVQGAPIVLGEFYGGPDTDALQRFKDFQGKGYAGAWAWSLFYDKTNDKMRIDLGAVANFTGAGTIVPAVPVTEVPAAPAPSTVQLLANWVSPTYASPGDTVTVHQDVRSTSDISVLLDFEVYDQAGTKVLQTALDNQALTTNGTASFSATVALPTSLPAGRYTVKTGAFTAGWGTMYAWNDSAGVFVVESTPAPTPVPAPEPDDPGSN